MIEAGSAAETRGACAKSELAARLMRTSQPIPASARLNLGIDGRQLIENVLIAASRKAGTAAEAAKARDAEIKSQKAASDAKDLMLEADRAVPRDRDALADRLTLFDEYTEILDKSSSRPTLGPGASEPSPWNVSANDTKTFVSTTSLDRATVISTTVGITGAAVPFSDWRQTDKDPSPAL